MKNILLVIRHRQAVWEHFNPCIHDKTAEINLQLNLLACLNFVGKLLLLRQINSQYTVCWRHLISVYVDPKMGHRK